MSADNFESRVSVDAAHFVMPTAPAVSNDWREQSMMASVDCGPGCLPMPLVTTRVNTTGLRALCVEWLAQSSFRRDDRSAAIQLYNEARKADAADGTECAIGFVAIGLLPKRVQEIIQRNQRKFIAGLSHTHWLRHGEPLFVIFVPVGALIALKNMLWRPVAPTFSPCALN